MDSVNKAIRSLVLITQVGLSVAGPLLGFTLLSVWLRNRLGCGVWLVIVGILVGFLGALGGLKSACRLLRRLPWENHSKKEKPRKINFTDHI